MIETTTTASETDGRASDITLASVSQALHSIAPLTTKPPTPLERDDWTNDLPAISQVLFFKSINWSATSLGPVHTWNTALRLHTHTVLADSRPACLYVGDSFFRSKMDVSCALCSTIEPCLAAYAYILHFPISTTRRMQVLTYTPSSGALRK